MSDQCEAAITRRSHRVLLTRLLAAAQAALEHDRDTARDCLVQAEALLRASAMDDVGATSMRASGGLAPWQVKRIRQYVEERANAKIRACDMAASVRLSTSHFFRAFRQTFGEAPMVYVARQRMLHAQEMMLRSGQPLAQVALACGLSDQAHFTRVFRRVVGKSPREWRREHSAVVRPRSDTLRAGALG